MRTPRELATVELDALLTEDQRRVSVAEHEKFRESLSARPPFDEIDSAVDEVAAEIAPPRGPKRLRKQSEVRRVLAILDELELEGKDGCE